MVGAPDGCLRCGKSLPSRIGPRGRPQKWCSNYCMRRAAKESHPAYTPYRRAKVGS